MSSHFITKYQWRRWKGSKAKQNKTKKSESHWKLRLRNNLNPNLPWTVGLHRAAGAGGEADMSSVFLSRHTSTSLQANSLGNSVKILAVAATVCPFTQRPQVFAHQKPTQKCVPLRSPEPCLPRTPIHCPASYLCLLMTTEMWQSSENKWAESRGQMTAEGFPRSMAWRKRRPRTVALCVGIRLPHIVEIAKE